MPRELARSATPVQRGEPLPARYWTQLEDVRVPGSLDRIDLVLVGPSGVHVVVDRSGKPNPSVAVSAADVDLAEAVQRAEVAATAVAGLLPLRYRHVIASEVRLQGLTEAAVTVGAVYAGSPDVLRHVWRHRERVVSTSEAAVIARLLRDRLEPFPAGPAPRPDAWWRRRPRAWAIGAAAVTGLAGAAAVAAGMPTPW